MSASKRNGSLFLVFVSLFSHSYNAHLRKEENRFLQIYLWTLELLYNTYCITNKPQVYTTGAGENVIEGYDDS